MHIGQTISAVDFNKLTSKGRKSSKALYTPSEDKLRHMDAVYDFYVKHADHVQYAVTLQTKLVVKRDRDLSEKQRISIEDDFRIFAKRLQREVYGMGHRRKPQKFSLMLLPILEGSLFSPEGLRTLHYHIGIGNVPADIDIKPGNQGWMSYITKEVEQGNVNCCDWLNAFVPEIALYS
jgi:hypothetical protein